MRDARRVRGVQALRDLPDDGQRRLRREPTLPLQPRGQRFALEQLHREVVQGAGAGLFVHADVEDPADGGVRHPAGELDLLPEPLEEVLVVAAVGTQRLERDGLVDQVVMRPVDLAHAAPAEQGLDPVAIADPLAGGEGLAGLEEGAFEEFARLLELGEQPEDLGDDHRIVGGGLEEPAALGSRTFERGIEEVRDPSPELTFHGRG